MCLLGVSFILLPILGVKSPPQKSPSLGREQAFSSLTCKVLKVAYYQNYCTDYNQILHSHKDHKILFVGLNRRKTNPRWRTAAIWKNQKSAIRNGSTDLREIWHGDAHWASEPDRKLKFSTFKNPRWRTAAILKIENRPHLRNVSTDLREIWHDDANWTSEADMMLKHPTFENPRWQTTAILKNGKLAIEQYILMRRPVRVKTIHRVGKNRIICCVIYFTLLHLIKPQKL